MTVVVKQFLRRWLPVALAGVMAIALSACNPSAFKTAEATQVSQLVARASSNPKTFNYALLDSYPNVFIPFTFEGLLFEAGNGELEPGLAESWTTSEDNLRIVFTLRPGLKWSDGQPLTVDDVLFSFNDVYFNDKIPNGVKDSLKIGKQGALPRVRKISDRQVEFNLPEPFAPFLRTVGSGFVLPAHILRSSVFEKDAEGNPKFMAMWGTDTDPKQIVVNGPYQITEFVPGQRVIFERNPYYWRKDASGRQQPYIERLIWQIVESPETALLQFRSGGLDMLAIGPTSFQLLKREEKRSDFTIYSAGPDSGISFVGFNLNKGKRNGKPLVDPIKSRWFNTVEFRQAVAYGLDRQTLINNIFRGLGELQNSPISVQSPYFTREGVKVYDYNPEKAKQLLQKAGFKYDNKGQLFDADGNRVRFTFTTPSGSRIAGEIASQFKRDLAKIGMQIDYQPIDFGTMLEKLTNTLDLETYYLGFTGGVEPNNASNLWLPDGSSHMFNQKPQPGKAPIEGREIADWEARIGDLFIQAARELNEDKRKSLYAEMQQIAQENVPLIYLVNPLVLSAIKNRVQGVDLSAFYYEQSLWNIYKLQVAD